MRRHEHAASPDVLLQMNGAKYAPPAESRTRKPTIEVNEVCKKKRRKEGNRYYYCMLDNNFILVLLVYESQPFFPPREKKIEKKKYQVALHRESRT